MTKMISICLMLAIFSTSTMAKIIQSEAREVTISPDNVHVPSGFDSNDTAVQVMVTGSVPNTCFLRPHGEAKVVGNTVNISMKATKISGSNVNCIQALVPYMATVTLGRLPEGRYSIVVNPGSFSEKITDLNVEKPNSASIDNFTYANVTNVREIPETAKIVLEGAHPSSCMEFDAVQLIANGNEDTFAVLPIIKQVMPICDYRMTPFTVEIPMPRSSQNVIVLHVRRLDGTAVNYRLSKNNNGNIVTN